MITAFICGAVFGFAVHGLAAAVVHERERRRVALQTIEVLRQFTEMLENGEPLYGTRISIEETPDGPLTTTEPIVLRREDDESEDDDG